jgi:hypothetical protein
MRIGTSTTDPTRPLLDGRVAIPDADVTTAGTLTEIFAGFVDGEYDIAEFGLTFFLRALEQGADLVALPVFPTRVYRHSCVFVHVGSGIADPADLVDKTIGEFGTYGQDSGVWAKGALSDDFGFRPDRNRWVIGGLDAPSAPFGFTTHPRPPEVEIRDETERSLSDMLVAGDLDALFTANVPQPVLDGDPRVRRLFVDHETVERDYAERTGIFPIMHALTAHRGQDGLDAVYQGFLASKDLAAQQYRRDRKLYEVAHMLPWTNALYERTVATLGQDWWPYGVAANRTTLDAFLRHHHEQGLSAKRWTVEEIVAPELLHT